MGNMLQERNRPSPPMIESPSKRFKEDPTEDSNPVCLESSDNRLSIIDNQMINTEAANPINIAARLISARAQILQQQALFQQQKSWNSLDSQQKLCQLLQLAHFQAYLASMVSRTKTE